MLCIWNSPQMVSLTIIQLGSWAISVLKICPTLMKSRPFGSTLVPTYSASFSSSGNRSKASFFSAVTEVSVTQRVLGNLETSWLGVDFFLPLPNNL